MNRTPIYKGRMQGSHEYVTGHLVDDTHIRYEDVVRKYYRESEELLEVRVFKIVPETLSIHFPNMIDGEGEKIFASLSSHGGSLVVGTCRDIGTHDEAKLHPPAKFRGVVKFYDEISMGVVIEQSGSLPPLRWSDCRQNIRAVGIAQ